MIPRLVLFALLLSATPAFADDPIRLKVLSFNIWYGGEQVSFAKTIEAIRAADADIVGLQEPDGNTAKIAEAAGYPYVDLRRHIISRVPLFDSGLGERTETGPAPYPMASLDTTAPHAWAMVAPGKVVAVMNLHLTSEPYGPNTLRDEGVDAAMAVENDTRVPEIEAVTAALGPVVASGAPVIVTGDFNAPSWRDWTAAAVGSRPEVTAAVEWPVSMRMEQAGFTDTFRAIHPDPVRDPGITYSPGMPNPIVEPAEMMDRIDFVWSANATPVDSVMMGEAGNPAVSIAVTPWPSDHRAVLSTIDVVPVEAPALIAVEPRLVREGATFLTRVNSPGRADWTVRILPRGGDASTDAIQSVEGNPAYWRSAMKFSTLGLAPGSYDAALLDTEGKELARTRFSVVPTDGRTSLSVAQNSVKPGKPITAKWAGAPGFRFDWLGIFEKGNPDVYGYLAFVYTGGTLEGEMTITDEDIGQSLAPGEYELRLMQDDSYATMAAAPFTVTAP